MPGRHLRSGPRHGRACRWAGASTCRPWPMPSASPQWSTSTPASWRWRFRPSCGSGRFGTSTRRRSPCPTSTAHPARCRDWAGRKRLLVTFSSWCGCRYDLPGWQALHDELAHDGFTVIAVAIDQSADDVRPFADGLTMPVLYDPHHLLTELYAISNVPTVVWIDERRTDRPAQRRGVRDRHLRRIHRGRVGAPPRPGAALGPRRRGAVDGRRGRRGRRRPVRGRGPGPAALPHRRRGPPSGRRRTPPDPTCCGPANWLPTTSRCGGPACRSSARTPSGRTSSTATRSGSGGGAPPTPCRRRPPRSRWTEPATGGYLRAARIRRRMKVKTAMCLAVSISMSRTSSGQRVTSSSSSRAPAR